MPPDADRGPSQPHVCRPESPRAGPFLAPELVPDEAPLLRSLGGVPIAEYLAALASEKPAPGGGSAAALIGAIGAALVSMICRLTLDAAARPGEPVPLGRALIAADALRDRLVQLAADDARVAGAMVELAHAMKREPDPERSPLRAQLQASRQAAAGSALAILEAGAETLELSVTAAHCGTCLALSDAAVAAAAAGATLDGAAMTVAINLGLIEDPEFVRRTRARVAQLMADAGHLRLQLLAEIQGLLEG